MFRALAACYTEGQMNRLLRMTVFLLAVGALLDGGCRRPPRTEGPVVTIHVADWGGASADEKSNQINADILREFHRLHPNIRVQMEHMPDAYVQKVMMTLLAGTQPDVIALDASSAAIFINNNALQDLTPFIEKDKSMDLGVFYPNVLNIARRGKALYALPANFTPMMMYYNRASFQKAGVPEPKDGWTWDDFRRSADSLTIRKRGKPVQYGFNVTNWMPGWITWIWQNGGDVLSPDGKRAHGYLDSEKSIAAITFYTDFVKNGMAPTTSEAQAMGTSNFQAGRVAMDVNGHWMIPSYRANEIYRFEDIGVVGLPRQANRVTVMYESGPAMMKGCKHPQEAYEYIKFVTGPYVQRKTSEQGLGISANRKIAEEFRGASPLEPMFLDNIQYARGPWGARVEQYALVEDIGREAIDEILLGRSTPTVALRNAARRIDIQLGED
jgi:multiple sugar transport system substrate-binding protein